MLQIVCSLCITATTGAAPITSTPGSAYQFRFRVDCLNLTHCPTMSCFTKYRSDAKEDHSSGFHDYNRLAAISVIKFDLRTDR
ncbi:hypothetical protein PHET_12159 [Paragonimus heterotremus]|uniref:C2H2-type domain-containing protein n=1 Tax=Paragonimus heterotremus TaxID=100268 RepID=A0A8J4T077_9TREM|nr:hypothetical protein PHET_12159 [Paragonimus heterotremus]